MLVSINMFAQGTVVFSISGTQPKFTLEGGGNVGSTAGASGSGINAILLEDIGGVWTEVANSQNKVGVPFAGRVLGTLGLPTAATPGGNVTLMVRAWEISYGSYDNALGKGLTGESASWTQSTGGAGDPPSQPVSIGGFWPGLTVAVVPEPSAIALGLLGAGALLLLRRRK